MTNRGGDLPNVAPLPNGKVGPNFLYSCAGLTSVYLTPLRAIEAIPVGLVAGGLNNVDFRPSANVREGGASSYRVKVIITSSIPNHQPPHVHIISPPSFASPQ